MHLKSNSSRVLRSLPRDMVPSRSRGNEKASNPSYSFPGRARDIWEARERKQETFGKQQIDPSAGRCDSQCLSMIPSRSVPYRPCVGSMCCLAQCHLVGTWEHNPHSLYRWVRWVPASRFKKLSIKHQAGIHSPSKLKKPANQPAICFFSQPASK